MLSYCEPRQRSADGFSLPLSQRPRVRPMEAGVTDLWTQHRHLSTNEGQDRMGTVLRCDGLVQAYPRPWRGFYSLLWGV
jgi:hypothetical protein